MEPETKPQYLWWCQSALLRFPLAGYLPPCKGGVNSRHRGGKKMEEIVERQGKLRPVMSRGNGGD